MNLSFFRTLFRNISDLHQRLDDPNVAIPDWAKIIADALDAAIKEGGDGREANLRGLIARSLEVRLAKVRAALAKSDNVRLERELGRLLGLQSVAGFLDGEALIFVAGAVCLDGRLDYLHYTIDDGDVPDAPVIVTT